MLISVVAFVAVLCLTIYWFLSQKNWSFAKNVVVVDRCYPFIGNGHLFVGKDDVRRFWNVKKIFDRQESLFRFFLGPKMVFGTCDPITAQQILTESNCMEKPYFYDYFLIGHGVFTAKTHIWRGQRKALNPTFNAKILESFISIFCASSAGMIERLKTIPAGTTINFMEHITRCTLEMVCATTLGFDVQAFSQLDTLGHQIERVFYIAARRMLNFHLQLDTIYRWTKDYQEERTLRDYLEVYGMQIYDDATLRFSKESLHDDTTTSKDENFRKPQIFVNQLFTNTIRKFDRMEIIHNIYTMVGAGTDTSATAISFTLLQLAMYPNHQQRLYEEIVEVFPEAQPTITLESLKRLKYTEMVLNECLRLYPVVPMVVRENTADITVNGLRVPKGNIFAVHIYNMHRRKDVWGPDADKFDPKRFSPERSVGRHPFAFLAFSAGSRNCLGSRYAMISMKIMMVYLAKHFRFKTQIREEDIRFKFDALLRVEGGHQIQLERRT